MLHQPSGGANGMAADIQIMAEEIIKTRARLNDIYAEHTGQVHTTTYTIMAKKKSRAATPSLYYALDFTTFSGFASNTLHMAAVGVVGVIVAASWSLANSSPKRKNPCNHSRHEITPHHVFGGLLSQTSLKINVSFISAGHGFLSFFFFFNSPRLWHTSPRPPNTHACVLDRRDGGTVKTWLCPGTRFSGTHRLLSAGAS